MALQTISGIMQSEMMTPGVSIHRKAPNAVKARRMRLPKLFFNISSIIEIIMNMQAITAIVIFAL
jgi:hypothetical protein